MKSYIYLHCTKAEKVDISELKITSLEYTKPPNKSLKRSMF